MSILPSWLSLVLPNVPIWLIWLVGLAIAFVTWCKHPSVSLTAFLACALLLTTSVTATAANVWLIEQQWSRSWDTARYSNMMAAVSLARVVFSTIGYVLLLVAIFGWRRQQAPARPHTVHEADLAPPLRQPGPTGIQPPDSLP